MANEARGAGDDRDWVDASELVDMYHATRLYVVLCRVELGYGIRSCTLSFDIRLKLAPAAIQTCSPGSEFPSQ